MMKDRKNRYPLPPEHLSERSKRLWEELVGNRIKSPGRITMFQEALEALDLADQARQARIKEGLVTITKRSGVSHTNPLLKIERENRQLFTKIWTTLNLYWDTNIDGY
jgi:hypothetical protein